MLEKIQNDLKDAQLAKDETKVSTLRMLLSSLSYAKIQKKEDLSDEEIIAVVQKEAKKHKESISSFKQGNREELAQKEEAELKVLEGYLPTQISDEELTNIVQTAINDMGAKGIQDMGKVIGEVMGKVGQSADGGRVSAIVKSKLTQ